MKGFVPFKTAILAAIVFSSLFIVMVPTIPSIKADAPPFQPLNDGDIITYDFVINGKSSGFNTIHFNNVTNNTATTTTQSTCWYYSSGTAVTNFYYQNGTLRLPFWGPWTQNPDLYKAGETTISTIYGMRSVIIYGYYASHAARQFYAPEDCYIPLKYTVNDDDGNRLIGTLSYTNIEWLKVAGGSSYPPTAPQNLTAIGSVGHITLNWEAPIDPGYPYIKNYAVYRGLTQDSLALLVGNLSWNTLSYSDAVTNWNLTYYYQVQALNANSSSPFSNIASANSLNPSVPSAPQNLTATGKNAQVVLRWSSPASDGGAPILNYSIYRGAISGGETLLTTTNNILNFTDSGLTNGQTYYYKVSALNAVGEGPQSLEASVTPAKVPSEPFYLRGTPGNGLVDLKWQDSNDTGYMPIDYYAIYQDGSEVQHTTTNMTTIYGLSNGHIYQFVVKAHNAQGLSNSSNPVYITPFWIPGPVRNLNATAGNEQAVLTWYAPSNNGGSAIDFYIIYQNDTDVMHVTTTSATMSGLINGISYHFRVSAHNSAGVGPANNSVRVVPRTVPDPPFNLNAVPGNRFILLTWEAPDYNGGANIDYYVIYRGFYDYAHVTNTRMNITGLVNGESYNFTVAAHNSAGIGASTQRIIVIPRTVPNAPTNLIADPGDGNVLLRWVNSTSDGGAPIDYYAVFLNGTDVLHVASNQTTITGLLNGQTYHFYIIAHNVAGSGPRSAEKSATPISAPGPPLSVQTSTGNGQVSISWGAPETDGGLSIDYYVVFQNGVEVLHSEDTFATVTGLTNGETYNFTVAAHNDVGTGTSSNSAYVTPQAEVDNTLLIIVIAIVATVAIIAIALTLLRRRS